MDSSKNSHRRIFFTDLDGTLLNREKIVTPKTLAALKVFTDAGNLFAICSGRALFNARRAQEVCHLNFPGSYIVAFNGAEIYDCEAERDIYRVGVPIALASDILALAREKGVYCQTYNDHFILSQVYNENTAYYRSENPNPIIVADDILPYLDKDPGKLICVEKDRPEKLEAFRDEVLARWGDVVTCLFSSPCFLEIFRREAGKGPALHRLAEYLGIPLSRTIAAGDAENDISMLKEAGVGIAMKNASPEAKAAADAVTEEDNDNDGLVPFLLSCV